MQTQVVQSRDSGNRMYLCTNTEDLLFKKQYFSSHYNVYNKIMFVSVNPIGQLQKCHIFYISILNVYMIGNFKFLNPTPRGVE
jgi:hypothetical protein